MALNSSAHPSINIDKSKAPGELRQVLKNFLHNIKQNPAVLRASSPFMFLNYTQPQIHCFQPYFIFYSRLMSNLHWFTISIKRWKEWGKPVKVDYANILYLAHLSFPAYTCIHNYPRLLWAQHPATISPRRLANKKFKVKFNQKRTTTV